MPAEPRHLQQGLDQRSHARRGIAHARQVLAPFLADRLAVAFAQDPAEAFDRAQRRAQVVGNAVGEGFQVLVGEGQLAGARGDPGFQRPVQRQHLGFGAQPVGDVLDLDQPRNVLANVAWHRCEGHLDLAQSAAAGQQGAGAAIDASLARAVLPAPLLLAGRKEVVLERGAAQSLAGHGQDPRQRRVGIDDAAIPVEQRLADRRVLHGGAEAHLAAPEGFGHARRQAFGTRMGAREDQCDPEQQQ